MKHYNYKILLTIVFVYVSFYLKGQSSVDGKQSSITEYPEWLYETRFKELDSKTPIKLDYNDRSTWVMTGMLIVIIITMLMVKQQYTEHCIHGRQLCMVPVL